MAEDPSKKLRIATIFSYGANEEESDGILDEENSEDTSALDQPSWEFLEIAIDDYNKMFHTINKAIDASPELRSKKQLIETFIAGINDVDDVMNGIVM